MNKLTNNFDRVAPIYDTLSCLVYFNSQRKAQADQIENITPHNRVLIIGGGAGWILEAITKHFESGLDIVFIDLSEKMLALAKKRNFKNNKVTFICGAIENYDSYQPFDVVMTAYLFDNFTEKQAKTVFSVTNLLLKKNGLWLITEFVLDKKYGNWWKKILLQSMFVFFKTFGMVEGKSLNDMLPLFIENQYSVEKKLFYYGHFIKGTVYRK